MSWPTAWIEDLRRSVRLDIQDLNYSYGSERIGKLDVGLSLPRKGAPVRLGSYLWHFIGSILAAVRWRGRGPVPAGSIAYFYASMNQRNSLLPFVDPEHGRMVAVDFFRRLDVKYADVWPTARVFLLGFAHFPLVLAQWARSSGYQRRTFSYALDLYLLTYGHYVVSRQWLRRVRPSAVVLADDHGMTSRALVKACRELGVPTVYIQHASVTPAFPPLSTDLALLEGRDALRKYEAAGSTGTRVHLIGSAKLDREATGGEHRSRTRAIGICTNAVDPPDRVGSLLEVLRDRQPGMEIVLRPHPGDRRDRMWTRMADRHGVAFAPSRAEPIGHFLDRVDAVIAGESNVLLEAALLDVVPLYYDFSGKRMDWYGFVEHGLAEEVRDAAAAADRVEELRGSRPSVRDRARYYSATVGTRYEGRVAELGGELIRRVAEGEMVPGIWKRIDGTSLEAYELAV